MILVFLFNIFPRLATTSFVMMVHSESEIIWKERNIHFDTLSFLFGVLGQCKARMSHHFLSLCSDENAQWRPSHSRESAGGILHGWNNPKSYQILPNDLWSQYYFVISKAPLCQFGAQHHKPSRCPCLQKLIFSLCKCSCLCTSPAKCVLNLPLDSYIRTH